MLLFYPLPSAINGGNLAAEIEGALSLPPGSVAVAVSGDAVGVNVPDGTTVAPVAAAVAAHTGQPTAAQQAEVAADAEAGQAVRNLEPILAKCRAVLAGTDTFTAAQRDRLLAALVLVVHRRLR